MSRPFSLLSKIVPLRYMRRPMSLLYSCIYAERIEDMRPRPALLLAMLLIARVVTPAGKVVKRCGQ